MTELGEQGFKVVKSYVHNHFITQRRVKGFLTVETTWDRDNNHLPCSQDVTIEETFLEKFSKTDLALLDKILNKDWELLEEFLNETRNDYESNG